MNYIKHCAICGKEFTTNTNASKYCSKECRHLAYRNSQKKYYRKLRKYNQAMSSFAAVTKDVITMPEHKEPRFPVDEYADRQMEETLSQIPKIKTNL